MTHIVATDAAADEILAAESMRIGPRTNLLPTMATSFEPHLPDHVQKWAFGRTPILESGSVLKVQ
jgi:hypothetical protein